MSNPYEEYYINQAGSGLPSFHGVRYQRGAGWFSNLLNRYGVPLLRYLGKQAATTGQQILGDVAEGTSVKEAAKKRLSSRAKSIASDALTRGQTYLQTGKGKKRKKKSGQKKKKTRKKTSTSIAPPDLFS